MQKSAIKNKPWDKIEREQHNESLETKFIYCIIPLTKGINSLVLLISLIAEKIHDTVSKMCSLKSMK